MIASYSLSESAEKPENFSSSELDTNSDSSAASNVVAVMFSKMKLYADRWTAECKHCADLIMNHSDI